MDSNPGILTRQRVDRERRAERRAADADVDEALHLTQQAFMDRLDQRMHAIVETLRFFYSGGIADAAFGHVGGGAAFGVVDERAGKQRLAAGGKIHGVSNLAEHRLDVG